MISVRPSSSGRSQIQLMDEDPQALAAHKRTFSESNKSALASPTKSKKKSSIKRPRMADNRNVPEMVTALNAGLETEGNVLVPNSDDIMDVCNPIVEEGSGSNQPSDLDSITTSGNEQQPSSSSENQTTSSNEDASGVASGSGSRGKVINFM